MRAADVDELRGLAATYARAVDRRDADLFVSVFAGDGVLELHDPASAPAPTGIRRGHDELARVVELIARFPQTFHFVGQSLHEVTGDEATGEVYCLAHHLSDDATDLVMFIRYDDEYRRLEGAWKITRRRVLVDWTERRPVDR